MFNSIKTINYYEQALIWDQACERYQLEVLNDILAILPKDAQNILDVGCGNGFITNSLPNDVQVIGMDISEEALSRVKRQTIRGSIFEIPLADSSYDLVMCNDVLEHFSEPERLKAITELSRVAKKYIIITTPLWEDLNMGLLQCPACSLLYHVNYHKETFSPESHRNFFCEDDWSCVLQVLSGSQNLQTPPETSFVQNILLRHNIPNSQHALCEHCGQPYSEYKANKSINDELNTEWNYFMAYRQNVLLPPPSILRTECISLFVKSYFKIPVFPDGFCNEKFKTININSRVFSTGEILFEEEDIFRNINLLTSYSRPQYINLNQDKGNGYFINQNEHILLSFYNFKELKNDILTITGNSDYNIEINIYYYFNNKFYLIETTKINSLIFKLNINLIDIPLSQYGYLFKINASSSFKLIKANLLTKNSLFKISYIENARFLRLDSNNPLFLSLSIYDGYLEHQPWMEDIVEVGKKIKFYKVNENNITSLSIYINQLIIDYINIIRLKIYNININKSKITEILFINLLNTILLINILNSKIKFIINTINLNNYNKIIDMINLKHSYLVKLIDEKKLELSKSIDEKNLDLLKIIDTKYIELLKNIDLKLNEFRCFNLYFKILHKFFNLILKIFNKIRLYLKQITNLIEKIKLNIKKYKNNKYIKEKIIKLTNSPSYKIKKHENSKKFPKYLMICHDQNIDRRIIQEASSLQDDGWEGIIIALSFDNNDELDEIERIKIHRISLTRIIPDCAAYWTWQKGIEISTKLPFSIFFQKINYFIYILNLKHLYNGKNIQHPLPFDFAFYGAAKHYKADVVQAHDLPALKTAVRLGKEWNVPVVYDAHEFYPEQIMFSKKQKKIMYKTELDNITKCSAIFTVNQSIAEAMAKKYQCAEPQVLLNAIDTKSSLEPTTDLLRKHFQFTNSDIIYLFQGGLSPNRNLEILIKAMVKVKNKNIKLVFMGDGPELEKLQNLAKKLNVPVFFKAPVEQQDVLKWSCTADLGIIPYLAIDLNTRYCTPNKLFEYIQADLPIIANDLPELRRFVYDTGFGKIINMNNSNIITNTFDYLSYNYDILNKFRQTISDNKFKYSWDYIKKEYILTLQKLIKI
jgi:SAM-dependent methyltransferase